MADTKTFDPGLHVVNFAGLLITGFADGTWISAERNADAFIPYVGADGEVSRARQRDRSGIVRITLAQTSASNRSLALLAKQDELFGTGVGALLIKDLGSTLVLSADSAWIQKLPTVDRAKEVGTQEWAIYCANLMFDL
jgi:hypothetical protein